MFPRFPKPLTQESFPQAWNYVSRKYRQSKKCYVTEHIVERVCHTLFLWIMLFFVCGLLYTHLSFPGLQEFFQKAPWFTDTWTRLYVDVLRPLSVRLPYSRTADDLIACIFTAWCIPFAVGAVLSLLVQLLYWPKGTAMPGDASEQEAALTLLNTARAARRNGKRANVQTAGKAPMFFLLFMGVLMTLFAAEVIQTKPESLADMLAREKYTIYLCAFASLFSFGLLSFPLSLLLKLLYWCPIPKAHFTAMEDHLKSTMPQEEGAADSQSGTGQAFPASDPGFVPSAKDVWFTRLTGFPCPITAETFPKAWHWASRKLQWAEKKALVSRVTNLIAHPIYFAVLMVLSFGALYQQNISWINPILDKAPKLVQLWKNIRLFLYGADAAPLQQGLAWARFLYLVPLVLSCLAALAVFLVYHPKSRSRDTADSPAEQSRQLCLLLREANEKAKGVTSKVTRLCNVAFAMSWGFLAFGLMVFYLTNPASRSLIEENGTRMGWLIFAVFLAMAVGYRIIALPLTMMLRLLTFTWIPKKAHAAAESWFDRCEDASAQEVPQQPQIQTAEE